MYKIKNTRLISESRISIYTKYFIVPDKEVSAQSKLSRRTLQDYRNEGRISYYQLGGKILYRESNIEKMLQENYREAYMSGK